MVRRFITAIVVCGVCVGCSFCRVDSRDTTREFYPPKATPDKIVYLQTVDRPYDVIGIVTVSAERTRPFEEVLTPIKREASILGGDAITDVLQNADLPGPRILKNAGLRVNYTAKVIVFK